MVIPQQRDVWWAHFGVPQGSEAGYRRPVVIVQADRLNRSNIATVVCVPLTTNLELQTALGNVLLSASSTGLPKESVANVSQLVAVNKSRLAERVSSLPSRHFDMILAGIDLLLGR